MYTTNTWIFTITLSIVLSVGLGQDDCERPPANWPQVPPQCCDLPFPLDSMKRQFSACVKQIGRPSSAVPTAKAVLDARFCIEECVYKGMGLLEGSSLNKNKLTDALRKGVSGKGQWERTMDQAISACFGQGLHGNTGSSCSEEPHAFTHCMMRHLFLNCPANQWTKSADCSLVKERMQACPNIPPPPPPPPQHLQQRSIPPQQFGFPQ